MKADSKKEAITLISQLVEADVGEQLQVHSKTGPGGVEFTIQVPRDATHLAELVQRLAALTVGPVI